MSKIIMLEVTANINIETRYGSDTNRTITITLPYFSSEEKIREYIFNNYAYPIMHDYYDAASINILETKKVEYQKVEDK